MVDNKGRLRKAVLASGNSGSAARTRRAKSRVSKQDPEVPEVPEVFQDLLSEATTSVAAGADEDSKPLKKRRTTRGTLRSETDTTRQISTPNIPVVLESTTLVPTKADQRIEEDYNENGMFQTVIDYSEESEESEFEWEDVGLGQIEGEDGETAQNEPPIRDLSIVIGDNEADKAAGKQVRRKGLTAADKRLRLDVHKMHLLCLLYHVHLRNVWCNDEGIQNILRKLPSPKMMSDLVPNPEHTQAQAAKCFVDGLQAIKTMWSSRFSITALGLHKPKWADSEEPVQELKHFDHLDSPMERSDFRKAAKALEGSQDVGAQLFCSLLRAIGVEARLVCSLQCLPFASMARDISAQTPKIQRNTVVLDAYASDASSIRSNTSANPSTASSRPKRISRLGQLGSSRNRGYDLGKPAPLPKPKKIYHTAYPVYWVEAFNSAVQKWVTVDPLSTSTVDKPDKIEPPLTYQQSALTYVVAFEEDSIAKDITKRYAKAYNAKTRRSRVESTGDGAKWWKKALKVFRRGIVLDRDQVEDAALARKEAAEGMPRNVQDFKDHPIYVLERHLKHNQVIHPRNEIGRINIGTATSSNTESVYRRRDVHIVKSADKWYRLGREVMDGEQPLKHAKRRKGTRHSPTPQVIDPEDDDDVGVGLYAAFQTELYIPPPVVRGRVPRNAYGNLDVYVPSMVPKGGVHIRLPDAAKAARIVGVDYADAVTGFQFKGRHGTAIIQGIVVANEYREAIEAVIDGFAYMKEEAENAQRSAEALRLWRRFLIGLRIAQRVRGYEIDGQTADFQQEIDAVEDKLVEQHQAGGFFPGADPAETTTPITKTIDSGHRYENDYGGVFMPQEINGPDGPTDQRGPELPEYAQEHGRRLVESAREYDMGDGFFREDSIGEDGGFIREDALTVKGEEHATFQEATEPDSNVAGRFLEETSNLTNSNPKVDTGSVVSEYNKPIGRTLRSQSPTEEEPGDMSKAGTPFLDGENKKANPPTRERTTSPNFEAHTAELEVSEPPSAILEPEKVDTSDDDRDSLPSNDPEDEDADPDWLVCLTD